jgi:cytoskeletal protein CcmA (bactofilin family)
MEPEKDTPPDVQNEPPKEETPSEPQVQSDSQPHEDAAAPADALSRTPEDLEQEEVANADPNAPAKDSGEKKVPAFKRIFRKINLYLLIFVLLVVVAGIIAAVNYFNSVKVTPPPVTASQTLSQSALKQLANTNATVGTTSQTLTIQGNTIIGGQTLARGNLSVAGNLQTGGSIQGPSITISGTSNLGTAQINNLQVAGTTAIQGSTTLQNLNVAGTSSFSGAMTASQITVTQLNLSGSGVLTIANHITVAGPSPNRTIDTAVLGAGGTASVEGSDTSGTLNINTGSSPTPGCFEHVVFAQAFTKTPRVIVSPVGSGAAETQYYVTLDETGFSICAVNAAPANQVFAYDYFITN